MSTHNVASESIYGTSDQATDASLSVAIGPGHYNISIEILAAATVKLQRSFDGGANWRTVETITASVEGVGLEADTLPYRLSISGNTGVINYYVGR